MIRVVVEMTVPERGRPLAEVAASVSETLRPLLAESLPDARVRCISYEVD